MLEQRVPSAAPTVPQGVTGARSLYVSAFALFLFAGSFKTAPFFAQIPVDFTLLLSVITVIGVVRSWARESLRVPRIMNLVLIAVVALAVPVLWSTLEGYSHTKTTELFSLTLLAAIAPGFLIRSFDHADTFCRTVAALGVVLAAAAFLSGEKIEATSRLITNANNPIALGRVCGLACLYFLLRAFVQRRNVWRNLVLAGLPFGAVVASGSRGPLVGLVLALLVAITAGVVPSKGGDASRRHRRRRTAGGLVVGGAAMVIVVVALQTSGTDRAFRLTEGNTARHNLYAEAWAIVIDNPVGVGWGDIRPGTAANARYYPHNIVLELAAEGGWLIGGAFVVLSLSLVWAGPLMSRHPTTLTIYAFFVFALANALVSSDLNGNRPLFAFAVTAYSMRRMVIIQEKKQRIGLK